MAIINQSTNKNISNVESLDACDIDDKGFIEGNINTGKVLTTFSFGMNEAPNDTKASTNQNPV